MSTALAYANRFFHNPSLGILIVRVMAGLVFLSHGWMKVEGISRAIVMFSGMGFPMFVAYFIAWLEVIGGIALVLGVATRIFGLLFGIEMVVAALLVSLPRGWNAMGFELLLAAVSFALAFTGSGAYSVLRKTFDRMGGLLCTDDGSVCIVKE
jgi:putative oxidoreductase